MLNVVPNQCVPVLGLCEAGAREVPTKEEMRK